VNEKRKYFQLERIQSISPAGTIIYEVITDSEGNFVELSVMQERLVDQFYVLTIQPL